MTDSQVLQRPAAGGASPAGSTGEPASNRRGAAYLFLVVGLVCAIAIPKPTAETFIASVVVALVLGLLMRRGPVASVGGVVIAVTGWLLRADLSALPTWSLAVDVLASGICFMPLATWRRRPDRFPLLGIFGAMQGVYIYVGGLVGRPSLPYRTFYPLHVREAGSLATLAYVVVLVGAGLMVRRLPVVLPKIRRWTSTPIIPTGAASAFQRAALLVAIGIVVADFHVVPASIAGRLGAIPSIIDMARIVGVALMAALWFRGQLSGTQKILTVAAIAADALAGTNPGAMLYEAVGCLIAGLIVLALHRPRLAMSLIVVLIPVAIVLNVAKTEVRAAKPRPTGHVAAASMLLHDTLETAVHPVRSTFTTSADRFDTSELLGYVAVHVPRNYPYWNKQSYIELPLVLVPRVLAPFKPKYTLANQFGRRYGLIGPEDYSTAVDTPIQVEAWANFGAPGLVVIAALVGAVLAMAESWFDPRRLDGLVLGVLLAYQASGGISSGLDAFALAVPIIVLFVPVVRWAIRPGGKKLGPIGHSAAAGAEASL